MSTEKQIIGTHAEAGFDSVDVLSEAEKGDSIELEMDYYDEPFEFVRGKVLAVNVRDTSDDDRMRLKNIHVDAAGEYEMIVLNVLFDPDSAHNMLKEEARFSRHGSDEYEFKQVDDLAHCQLERDGEDE